jgi:hypothetical protein
MTLNPETPVTFQRYRNASDNVALSCASPLRVLPCKRATCHYGRTTPRCCAAWVLTHGSPMSNQKPSDDLKNIADTAKASAEIVKALMPIYHDALQPLAKELGKARRITRARRQCCDLSLERYGCMRDRQD